MFKLSTYPIAHVTGTVSCKGTALVRFTIASRGRFVAIEDYLFEG